MKTFYIDDIHKINISKSKFGYTVVFFELYGNNWIQIGPSELYSADAIEDEYGINKCELF